MIDGDQPITAKNFAILQQDMINAMAPGGAATEGKVNREMVETFAGKLNDLALKFGSIQDLRKEQPQIFNQLKGLIKNIHHDYNSALQTQVQALAENYENVNVPEVQKTVQKKVERYKMPGLLGAEKPAQGPSEAEKQAALEWAAKSRS